MTQLEYARRGVITEQMQAAALAEGVTPEFIRDGLAAGTIVICHNVRHTGGTPLPVGAGLRTKVNANIGSSSDDTDMQKELEKAKEFITAAIRLARPLGKGHSPINHFMAAEEIKER